MPEKLNRREFMAAGAAATAGLLLPRRLRAEAPKINTDMPGKLMKPDVKPELHGKPLDLPRWKYGKQSTSTETMLMFRGNPTHTFYGTGPLSENPKKIWEHEHRTFKTWLRGHRITWTGTGWTGQPARLGDYVFIGSTGQRVYAYEAETGKLRWELPGGRMYKGSMCIYENRLYMGNTDNYFRCVDAATGEVVWQMDTGTDCDSSPVVVDDKLYVAGESGNLHCMDPRTGKYHWVTYIGGFGKGTKGGSNGSETSPAIADGEVFVADYDGFMHCFDAKTGKRKWKVATNDDTDVSAVVVDELVYIAGQEKAPYLYCFDRSKKGETVWKFKNETGWWSTPAVVGDRLYIGGDGGKVYCLNRKTGKEIWSGTWSEQVWSSPAVVDGKVVFGTRSDHIYMVDAKTGKEIWKGDMGGRTISTPIVVDGKIYIGSSTGKFACFG